MGNQDLTSKHLRTAANAVKGASGQRRRVLFTERQPRAGRSKTTDLVEA